MIVGVGCVLLTLGLLARDLRVKKNRHNKKPLDAIRICLTGGPYPIPST